MADKKRTTSDGHMVNRIGEMPKYEKPKPSLHITEDELPAIKKWEVGKTYKVVAHVKMVHHAEGKEYSYGEDKDSKKHTARFEVHKVSPLNKEKK